MPSEDRKGPSIVAALVCSAGGQGAIIQILAALPAWFPGAIVVLRHQVPRVDDLLVPLLRPRTVLPVVNPHDGERLRRGTVAVAPPGHHTLITADGRIALIVSGDRPPYRPSADLLLTSMALSLGSRAAVAVLSGYGNDGATGATAIHRFGGTVIACDRATSQVFTMPSATIERDKIVDYVTPVDQIAPLLVRLAAPLSRPAKPALTRSATTT